jgi:hypothetical protein
MPVIGRDKLEKSTRCNYQVEYDGYFDPICGKEAFVSLSLSATDEEHHPSYITLHLCYDHIQMIRKMLTNDWKEGNTNEENMTPEGR